MRLLLSCLFFFFLGGVLEYIKRAKLLICILILLTGLLKITVKLTSSFIIILLNNITTGKYIPSVDIARFCHNET